MNKVIFLISLFLVQQLFAATQSELELINLYSTCYSGLSSGQGDVSPEDKITSGAEYIMSPLEQKVLSAREYLWHQEDGSQIILRLSITTDNEQYESKTEFKLNAMKFEAQKAELRSDKVYSVEMNGFRSLAVKENEKLALLQSQFIYGALDKPRDGAVVIRAQPVDIDKQKTLAADLVKNFKSQILTRLKSLTDKSKNGVVEVSNMDALLQAKNCSKISDSEIKTSLAQVKDIKIRKIPQMFQVKDQSRDTLCPDGTKAPCKSFCAPPLISRDGVCTCDACPPGWLLKDSISCYCVKSEDRAPMLICPATYLKVKDLSECPTTECWNGKYYFNPMNCPPRPAAKPDSKIVN